MNRLNVMTFVKDVPIIGNVVFSNGVRHIKHAFRHDDFTDIRCKSQLVANVVQECSHEIGKVFLNCLRQVVQIDRNVLVGFIAEIDFVVLDVKRIIILKLHEHFMTCFDVRIFKVIRFSAVYIIVISLDECLSLLLGSIAYDELVLFKICNRILRFLFVCLRII